ncbi:glycosyltransferase [Microvirga sp. ACRRW]|uniref:glycosyltransferase n=1 Tax=Microvirga sp. ACRRW TaxID=2918205 RepID=UPI001EF4AFBC|nr:glycosyltransferase [Microvirga sp. ACRRW]MCG7392444.1 glycosyltransferase [Microvirga sp. ACRRW]
MSKKVSIAICTDGRVESLRTTLASLRQLDYRNFEVCVVYGPTPDGTREMLESWPDPLKVAACPLRNLSMSRNIAIELSAGDIVAFLDDDAIPEPEWLGQIVDAYADDKVGGVGGFVHHHDGVLYQWRYGTTDRLGRADRKLDRATPEYNFPLSTNFPHLLGANSTFRRKALISIGGFDEEYDYFLDETDLACRLIDEGWHIAQLDGAVVHHKYMPSAIRTEKRVLSSWYSIIKNKIYYGFVNNKGHHGTKDIIQEATSFIDGLRRDLEWAISEKLLPSEDLARFNNEVERAWNDGLRRGLSMQRRLLTASRCDAVPSSFKPYLKGAPTQNAKTFCLLTREYPPTKVGGVGRYVHQLAKGLADLGHHVHVITAGEGHDRVDWEEGVWVYRIASLPKVKEQAATAAGPVPEHIWSYAASRLAWLERIAARRHVDCVYSPIWDCEGAAILRDGRFPVVLGLQTTLQFWLDSHPEQRESESFMTTFGRPMLALEKEMLLDSHAIHGISASIVKEIEAAYDVDLSQRAAVVQLGAEDYAALPKQPAPALVDGVSRRVLFVGRLEARKGIDVLLDAAVEVLTEYPDVQFDIVGNDKIQAHAGKTYRELFEERDLAESIKRRIVFHGAVSEEELRGFYDACDIFVAPSRFESFGLIFVEAMTFAKPVVGCRAGGMPEVILDGETGLLAEPGDAQSLREALKKLLNDPSLRSKMGHDGRRRYEQSFTVERMVKDTAELLVAHKRQAARAMRS